MRRLILATLVAAVFPSPVLAQVDSDSTSTFRGFRVEGNVGGDRFSSLGQRNTKLGYGATFGFDGAIGNKIIVGPRPTGGVRTTSPKIVLRA